MLNRFNVAIAFQMKSPAPLRLNKRQALRLSSAAPCQPANVPHVVFMGQAMALESVALKKNEAAIKKAHLTRWALK